MQHWLYVSFPCLSLDMRFCGGSEHKTPVAIYREEKNTLAQVNKAAIAAGILPGMGMAQAAALSTDLSIFPYDEIKELQYLTLLANRVYQVVSDIVIDQSNALAIRLDNLGALYSSTSDICQTVFNTLSGMVSDMLFADGWNIASAKILARTRANQCRLTQQAMLDAIHECSLSATDLPGNTVKHLSRIGITTLQALFALPYAELAKRLDNTSLHAIKQIRETNQVPPSLFSPEEVFSHTLDTPFDFETVQQCRRLFCVLLDELEVFLRVRNLVSTQITLTLSFREAEPFIRDITSSVPIGRASDWIILTDSWLEYCELPEPVVSVALACKQLEPDAGGEKDLFSNRHSYFMQAQLIGRLKTRLGDHAVRQPLVIDDHRLDPVESPAISGGKALIKEDCPLFTLTKSQPLQEKSNVIFGPHRIQTGWWDSHYTTRDYFIVMTEQGRYLQVYRNRHAHWEIAGVYC